MLGMDSTLTDAKKKALSNIAILTVIEKDSNQDGVLNTADEEITYISDLGFTKMTQIIPPKTQLLHWSLDPIGKSLFLYVKQDTNTNQEFDDLDKRSIMVVDLENPAMARTIVGTDPKHAAN